MTVPSASRLVVPPEAGERIWVGPISTIVKVPAAMADGGISITEMDVPAGYMVPPHNHGSTDEWSFVVRGTIGARIGDEELSAGAGSWVLKPRGLMHTFWNAGPEAARIIELMTPGRFEYFFREMAELAAGNELDDERLVALAATYDTTLDMTWVPELTARYGVEVTL